MKELRRFDIKEATIETRMNEEGKKRFISGHIPYNTRSVSMGGIYEVIAPSAFKRTINNKSDVKALINHDETKVLGSTKSGTLQLRDGPDGLYAELELPNTTYAADLYEVIQRGDVQTLSFGFVPEKYKDEGQTRTLTEVNLKEISYGVVYPAYPSTSSKTYLRSFVEDKKIDYEQLENVFSKIKDNKLEETDKDIITKFINELSEFVKPPIEPVKEAPAPESTASVDTSKDDLEKFNLILDTELALLSL